MLSRNLTEQEVHGTDLVLFGIDDWHCTFVDAALPVRLAWLELARITADGADVQVIDLDLEGAEVAAATVEQAFPGL